MRRGTGLLLAVLSTAALGCEGGGASSTRITSDTLTVYAGLPLRGERADDGRAVLRGMKLALDGAGGRVGELDIGLVALDDTRTATGRWDAHQVAVNARIAAENPSTVAYIGDLDAGATAVALPLTNEIGILHVSPLGAPTALTEDAGLYPSGRRTFARLVPSGAEEARALARRVARRGVRRAAIAQDGGLEGLGRGTELERALQAAGVEVTEVVRVEADGSPADFEQAAADLSRADAGAVIFAGGSVEAAAAVLGGVLRAAPGRRLHATSGVAPAALARVLVGAGARVRVMTSAAPAPPSSDALARRYRQAFGASMPTLALHGHAAMRGLLEAITRAGERGNDRRAVIDAWFASEAGPVGVLGEVEVVPGGVIER